METKQNYNGDIKTEMEELEKLNCTQSEELEEGFRTLGGLAFTIICCY